jgi:RHS repeat-associated protein
MRSFRDLPLSAVAVLFFVICVAGSMFSQTITSISPTSGAQGTPVTITGTGFGATKGSSTVTFASTTATIKSWSSTQIVTSVPQNQGAATISVFVTVGGVKSNQVSFTLTNPQINQLSTNSAQVDQELTITGVNFGSSGSVTFNKTPASPSSWSSTSIVTPVPAGATTGNIVVTTNSVPSVGYEFMVVPAPPPPGVQFIQGNWKNGASGTTSTLAFPISQNARDLNVVIVSWGGTNSITSVTDSAGNTYALAVGPTSSSSSTQAIYYAEDILESGENVVSVVFSSAPTSPNLRIAEYSGLALTGPLDVTAASYGTGSASNETANSGNATTTNLNDLLVGASAVTGMGTEAAGTGYTSRVITTINGGNILEDRIVTSTGSYNGTALLGCDDPWVMQMVAFKEAQNQAPVVDAGPNQTITLPVNTVTLDGVATDDGLPNNTLTISWSKVSGPGTVTFSSPSTAVSQATFSTYGVYVLQLTANDSELSTSATTTVTVNPEPISIVLNPAMVGPNVTGTTQAMTATVTIGNTGSPISGASVQFTVTGANATTGNGTTNSSGVATFSYTGAKQGADTVQATSSGNASNTVSITWITPLQPISTSTILGRFFPSNNAQTFNTPTTATPVFTQEFPTINFNPPAGIIPGNTSSVTVNSRPMTDVTTDFNGNYTGTIVAQGNNYQAGVGPMYYFQAVFTGSFTVKSAGTVNLYILADDGWILGISGGVTRVSGPLYNEPPSGVTPFEQYNIVGCYNEAEAVTGTATVINVPAPGTYQYELDYFEADGGQEVMTMAVGSNGPGAAPTGSLTITPINPVSINVGGIEILTVTASDGSGAPVPNLGVALNVGGANFEFLSGTTSSAGQVTFQYKGANAGADTVQAVANISGMASLSNVVTVPWSIPSGGSGGCSVFVFTPQGWIGSPAIGAVIQGQVPITLASGITLSSGTLTMSPSSNPNQITVLNSNTTGTGPLTLGTIDSTLLANGEYTIQLEATQSGGSCQLNEIVVSVTGQYKPGREVVTVTDFKVPLAGIPINITRTYDSLNRATVGDFGNGWNLSTNVNLSVDQLMNVTFTWNGKAQTFYFTPQSAGQALFPWIVSPAYTPQPGLYGTLTSNGCDILIYSGGALVQVGAGVVCFPGGTYQPTIYTYTDPSGRVYTIASTGQVQSIKDLNGNTLSFTPTGITSSVGGVVVPFVRDSQNRITQITDLAGNNYTYSYNSSGNLQSVQYPGLTATAAYTYAADHSLLTQTDPVGNETVATYDSNSRLLTFTDAMNDEWQYSYSVSTNTTTTTDPDGGAVVETDDNFGRPLSVTDPLNRTTTYTYDANENMLTMTDPLTNTTTYTYDSNGNQTSVTDPLGNKSTKTYNQYAEILTATDAANTNTQTATYNANFDLIQVTDLLNGPGTQVYSATYDSLGDVLTSTDANGKTTENAYDPKGDLIQSTDPLNEVTHNAYDAMDRLLSQTDPRGNTTNFTYDALGNLKTKTDALSNVTSYTYDNNGNKLSATDANKHTTNYQYDALNRLIKTTYPDSTTKQDTYNFRGNKLTETDQSSRISQYAYDKAGEFLTVIYAYGTADTGTVTYTYDADSRQKTIKDEVGNTTTNNYDAASRLSSVQDALSNITSYGYDADSRLTSITDPNVHTTSYTYDARSRSTRTTYNDSTTAQYTYDGIGHVLTTTDQAGQVTTDAYDAVGRLLSVKDALNNLTQYSYDLDSNLSFVTDADGRVTSYQYDPLNRVAVRILPLSQAEYKTYDPVSNLASKTDFDGHTTTYTYDTLNRLLTKVPAVSLSEPTIAFTYTPTGKRASMADASGSTTYTYNNRDHVVTEATPEGKLTYTHDAHENLLTIASSNTNGASATYTYDALNRLASAKDNRIAAQGGPSNPTTYSYDPAGNLAGYAYPNTVQTSNVFNTLNRLTQTCQATTSPACSASSKLGSFTYTLGAAGDRTAVAELSGRGVSYGYDNDYHLLSETITSDPAGNNGSETYTYDAVGNRLTLNSTIPSLSGGNTYVYDSNDRLSTETYDNDGNTTVSVGITNTYDFENHMLKHGSVSMVYDGDGNRVSETGAGVTTKYLVDTLNPTRYSQVLDELVSGAVTKTYTYGLQRISENQLVSSTWTPSFYGYDGHGNVRFLTSSAGSIGNTYTLDAFGAQIASTGTIANSYLYSGERFDSNLNLYQLRARYYNMLTGRFETMDPKWGEVFNPGTLHKYVYAQGNPVNAVDPTGNGILDEGILISEVLLRVTLPRTILSISLAICPTIELIGKVLPVLEAGQQGLTYFGIELPEVPPGLDIFLDQAQEFCEANVAE